MGMFLNGGNKRIEELEEEIVKLQTRLLSAAGDDLCRLTPEEIKEMSSGGVKIPPKEEFLASCERFHSQIAAGPGVMNNCLTLAQLIAENEMLRRKVDGLETEVENLQNHLNEIAE